MSSILISLLEIVYFLPKFLEYQLILSFPTSSYHQPVTHNQISAVLTKSTHVMCTLLGLSAELNKILPQTNSSRFALDVIAIHLIHMQVVSVSFIKAGDAHNVIPESVTFGGTFRSLTTEGIVYLTKRIKEVRSYHINYLLISRVISLCKFHFNKLIRSSI